MFRFNPRYGNMKTYCATKQLTSLEKEENIINYKQLINQSLQYENETTTTKYANRMLKSNNEIKENICDKPILHKVLCPSEAKVFERASQIVAYVITILSYR